MSTTPAPKGSRAWPSALISLGLVVVTAAVFWQVSGFEFINFDDDLYLTANPRVQRGLTWDNIAWAFTTIEVKNWHPLTWVAHMLDVQLFGMDAGAHHLSSVFLHIVNALLLFHLLRGLTRAPWRSGLAAALFALHPLHVESVAWISERKDLLSTLFWLLALWAYARFVASRSWRPYLALVVLFALGLMTKPMVVTLPFTLLLLDVWPLRRITGYGAGGDEPKVRGLADPGSVADGAGGDEPKVRGLADPGSVADGAGGDEPKVRGLADPGSVADGAGGDEPKVRGLADPGSVADGAGGDEPKVRGLGPLVVEKLPLFAISLGSAAITVFAQEAGGAVRSLEAFPLHIRVGNALVAYGAYLWNTFVPSGLAILYPHPGEDLAWWRAGVSLVVLALITAAALLAKRRHPWFIAGWFWFLGTLVPVIGIVQVGAQSRADRYTYVPLIGLFVALSWGLGALAARMAGSRAVVEGIASTAAALSLASLAVLSFQQVSAWQSSLTLFAHTLAVTEKNAVAHNNYANALLAAGREDEARAQYAASIDVQPDYVPAISNLGDLDMKRGRTEEALARFHEVLRIDPRAAGAHTRIGDALFTQGKTPEAIARYREAIGAQPRYRAAHMNLATALMKANQLDDAARALEAALDLDDRDAKAWNSLGVLRARAGKMREAADCFRAALRVDPSYEAAKQNLARASR